MNDYSYLSKRIRDARLRARLSQSALADRLGIRQSAVSQWEQGWTRPSMRHLLALADVLGIPLADLVTQREPAEQAPGPPRREAAGDGGG